jgi:hypothetical protein
MVSEPLTQLGPENSGRDNGRIKLVLAVLLYLVVFNWTYQYEINESVLTIYGFVYNPPPWPYQVFSWIAALLPALWMPINVRRPSLILFYALYILTYIPTAFVLFHVDRPALAPSEACLVVLILLISLSIIQLSYFVRVREFARRRLSRRQSLRLLVILSLVIIVGLVFLFRPIMTAPKMPGQDPESFMSSDSETRDAAYEHSAGTFLGARVVGYLLLWTQGAVLPFFMALALFRSKYALATLLSGVYVLTYLMQGTRAALISPFAILLAYLWLKRESRHDAARLAVATVGILFLGSILRAWSELGYTIYLTMIRFRLFESNVYNIALYYDFFKHHPWTYFTHITGVAFFIANPYVHEPRALPFAISGAYYNPPWDLNAGLWAQDGIGSLGLMGVPIVSVVCGALFWFFDSVTSKWNPRLVAVTLAVLTGLFMNIPLATFLVSDGLGVLLLLYWFIPEAGPEGLKLAT